MSGWLLAALSPDGVAPTIRRSNRELTSVEALALVNLGSLREYDNYNKPEGTSLTDLFEGESDTPLDPGWSLVRAAVLAMAHNTEKKGAKLLDELSSTTAAPAEVRAVAGLMLSVAFADSDRHEDALEAVTHLIEEIQLPALPSAALLLQQSLRKAEIGDYVGAHSQCVRAGYVLHVAEDLSEYAESSSSNLSFTEAKGVVERTKKSMQETVSRNLAVFESMTEEGRFKGINLASRDEAHLQLRYKLLSRTATRQMKELFDSEIRDRSTHASVRVLLADDSISRDLHALWLCSQLSGDIQDVQWSSELLGKERMLRREEAPEISFWYQTQGVQLLRRSGSHKSYSQAIRLVREEGSLRILENELRWALAQLSENVNRATLEAIKAGAVLLDEEEANSVAAALLTLSLPPYQSSGSSWYTTREPFWDAISALTREVSDSELISSALRERIVEADSVTAQRMLPVVSKVKWGQVSGEERARWIEVLSENFNEETGKLREAVLREFIEQRDQVALSIFERQLGDKPNLPQSAILVDLHQQGTSEPLIKFAPRVMQLCRTAIATTMEKSAHGAYSFGEVNEGLIATVISVDFPHLAEWGTISKFLRNPEVSAHKKDPVFNYMTRRFDEIPESVRLSLSRDPDSLSSRASVPLYSRSKSGRSGPRLRFLSKASALSSTEILSEFLGLAGEKEAVQRIEAARSAPAVSGPLGPDLVLGFLLALVEDDSPLVRSAATESLAYFATTFGGSSVHAVNAMGERLLSDGVSAPFGVLRGMRKYGIPEDSGLRIRLEQHLKRTVKMSSIPRVRRISSTFVRQMGQIDAP
ncbi:hypothetical protein [Streptomyces phaeochromogenes]|uniref:hypothetical protein n=1 Tax=Streptomyces phaeochromogenes TaxID=1923 RepID=UPI002DD8DEDE|nr:hypothetical protein [Streptomyces phaeochromogenes]WRZ30750.1 hypothetical protein OG931_24920 [Streptomyces phaeochromogenes]